MCGLLAYPHLPRRLRQTLVVIENRLAVLPDSLTRATRLHALKASYNLLTTLPLGMADLTKLRAVSLDHCPLNNRLAKAYDRAKFEKGSL